MKFRKIILSVLLICTYHFVNSQNIGINSTGATPNAAAMLDVDVNSLSTKKGLLIPRLTSADKIAMNPLPSPAQGLIVYQTDGIEGFYYNTSTTTTPNWVYLLPGSGTTGGWNLTGNIGTDSTQNFIGTTDRKPIIFRTDSLIRGVFSSNGFFGLNTNSPRFDLYAPAADSGFAFLHTGQSYTSLGNGPSTSFNTPFTCPLGIYTLGPGRSYKRTQFIWKSSNGALRAGLYDVGLSTAKLEDYSIGIGATFNPKKYGVAIGVGCYADTAAVALGYNSSASGNGSFAICGGKTTKAGGIAFGGNVAGSGAISIGPTYANGDHSIAMGYNSVTNGNYSIGIGYYTKPQSTNAMVIGSSSFSYDASGGCYLPDMLDNYTSNSLVIGFDSDTATVFIGPSAGKGTTGNVGIGNSNPAEKLDVSGKIKTQTLQVTSGASSNYVLTSDASGNAGWQALPSATTIAWGLTGNSGTSPATNFIGTTSAADFVFKTNAIERARILSTGNIGIGTVAPIAQLDIRAASVATASGTTGNLHIMSTDAQAIDIGGSISLGGYNDNAATALRVFGTIEGRKISSTSGSSSGYLSFKTNNGGTLTERLRIDNVGNVGIGTTTAINKLDIEGAAVIGSGYSGTNTAPSNGLLVEGNVGIANTSPLAVFHTNGEILSAPTTCSSTTGLSAGNVTAAGPGSSINFIDRAITNLSLVTTAGSRWALYSSGTTSRIWTPVTGDIMAFTAAGNVGIGTSGPTKAKLEISGTQNNTLSYGYLNSGGSTGTIASGTAAYSVYASGRIAATEFNAYSDKRIKNIKGISNNAADLKTLMEIEVTDYTFIDSLGKGDRISKKVIAQQVEDVYPCAVSKLTDVVPDIYKLAEINSGRILISNTLKKGEKVKLILAEREELTEVLLADSTSFTVGLKDIGKVFVFGREVNDFRAVDYEALTTLNISATQELMKLIRQQSEIINFLKVENTNINDRLSSFESELQKIKSLLGVDQKSEALFSIKK